MASVASITFLVVTVMLSTASAKGGIGSCCRKTGNTEPHRDLLKCYYIQHPPSCYLHAVVFITLTGRRICSNPHKLWTQTSMAYLDGKNGLNQGMNFNNCTVKR